jgi:DNA-binding NtrC family response regulator
LREDLYFRLRVFPIELPPLREREGDVGLLAEYFLGELNRKNDGQKILAPEALEAFAKHNWPGNVRELKHALHRSYILAEDDLIGAPERFDEEPLGDIEGLRAGRSIADVEKDLILKTLEHLGGDKKAAALSLGVSVKTLYNRLSEYEKSDAAG